MTFNGIDFDQLVDWAQNDPEKLEAFKRKQVNKLIDRAAPDAQRRLRGLQFQIESQCKLHRSPVARCVHLSNMMHDSLKKLGDVLNDPKVLNAPLKQMQAPNKTPYKEHSAKILAFPVRKHCLRP